MDRKDLKEVAVNAIARTSDYRLSIKETLLEENETILKYITSTEFRNFQQSFDDSFTNQSRFYRNYMIIFEAIFMFIRASRKQSWALNLYDLHSLCPYCFCILDDQLCSQDTCLSFTDVWTQRKRSLNSANVKRWKFFRKQFWYCFYMRCWGS